MEKDSILERCLFLKTAISINSKITSDTVMQFNSECAPYTVSKYRIASILHFVVQFNPLSAQHAHRLMNMAKYGNQLSIIQMILFANTTWRIYRTF